jgi:hypothetical protein
LARSLRERGIVVWIDESEIAVGDSLFEKIGTGITNMQYLGVVLSPASVKSTWVQREVEIALAKEINGRKVAVLPILYKPCEVPPFLQSRLYADFRSPDSFPAALGALLSRLLELSEGHILRKSWHPKAVRYGLKIGVLEANNDGVVFSSSFRRNLCDKAAEYLRGDLNEANHLGEVVAHAAGSMLAHKTLPLTLSEVAFLLNELTLHTVKLAWDLARRARIFVASDNGSQVDPALEQEVFDELLPIFAPEDAPSEDARRIFSSLLIETVVARIVLYSPADRDLASILGAFIFDSIYKELVMGLEQRAWTKSSKASRNATGFVRTKKRS